MSTTKTAQLTDTQLVILAQAAQRPDGCVLPLPSSLRTRGGAATNVLKSLLRHGLIAEQPASRRDEAWRHDEVGVPMALVITPAGLSALGLGSKSAEAGASERENDIGRSESAHPNDADGANGTADADGDASGRPAAPSDAAQRPGTKAAALVALIERNTGATLPELMAASGWQAHSVRGFLSGTLRKKLGRVIVSDRRDDGVRRYRIAG